MKFKSRNPSHLKGTGYTRDQIMKCETEKMGFHEDPRDQILAPIRAVLNLCVKPANRLLSRKSKTKEEKLDRPVSDHNSPLDSPRRLLKKISNKGVTSKLKKSRKREKDEGVWQKAILMGEKCQPPEFSGVIYYDYDGKQLSEPPMARSPRASPLPSYLFSGANEREKDEGVWQKAILMGEKCQPPEFSGVIYYDYDGKQLSEPPMAKSPRASPLPSYLSSGANDGI